MGSAPSCLVVDGDPMTLAALDGVLRGGGLQVVGTARAGVDALLALARRPATVIVLPLDLPDLGAAAFARRAAEIARSKTRIVFSARDDELDLVTDALDLGDGIVLLDDLPAQVLRAVRTVADGGVYVDPRLRPGTAPW